MAAAFFVVLALMDALPPEPLPYRAGQYVPSDINARVAFRVLSKELQAGLQRKVENTAPPVFKLNTALIDEITGALKNLPEQLKATTQPSNLDKSLQKQFAFTADSAQKIGRALAEPARGRAYHEHVEQLRRSLPKNYIVRSEALRPKVSRIASNVIITQDADRTPTDISELISLTEEGKVDRKLSALAAIFDERIQKHVKTYLENVFSKSRPIYLHDAAATLKDIEDAKRAIETDPPDEAYRPYASGQLLARQSRWHGPEGETVEGLSQADLNLLAEEHVAFLEAERKAHPWRSSGRLAGRTVILLALAVLLCLYIAHYQPKIVRNHWRGLGIAVLLLLTTAVSRAIVFWLGWNPHLAVFPVLLATIILTIAYDQRFALALGAILSALVVLQIRQELAMLIVMLAGAAASVFQLHEIRTRSKLIETSAIVAGVIFAMICALGLFAATPWKFVLADGVCGAGAALLAGLFVQGFLPLIERIFHIATSMTLLEWCDASKPLLKRLATEAPGTYNHSLQLGAMCETAATAIGARGLLARVGAYYHDVGKVNKPTYFVENQADSPSRHDKLSPAMSLLIIIGHVKDGLEMAREYSVPPILHEFIATHHGTTLVQYFYQAATEQRKSDVDRAPDEVEFRYPGPKPRTKETGILTLADAAESSVRTMSEPTPGRIESQVHTMVNRRLMDGQLDECDMTLKEVHLVEASLVKSLCGIYHARIAYPPPAGQKPSVAELQAAKKEQTKSGQRDKPERPLPGGAIRAADE